MITYNTIIAFFPELGRDTTYTEAQFAAWIPIAYSQLDAWRFGAQLDLAAALFVAHNVVISARDQKTASAKSAIVGSPQGPITNKAVGQVSVGYSPDISAIKDGGPWNLTTYGQRLRQMMKGANAGPFYVPAPASVRERVWPWPRFPL